MLRKYLFTLLAFCFVLLVACSNETAQKAQSNESTEVLTKLKVYTTVYPLSYFTERIGGEFVKVSSVYPPGANEHSFEPTQQDMIKLAESDLIFYIGYGLESFIENAQVTLKNEKVEFVATTDNIPEEKLNMSTGDSKDAHSEEDEDAHAGEAHSDEEVTSESEDVHAQHNEIDAHVWLSTSLSADLALAIKNALTEKMPEQSDKFEANYQTLVNDLEALDIQFKEMVAQADTRTFFVSHAAFGYIAGEYGLQQVPIAGLNSQNEPSQKELLEVVSLAEDLEIQYVLFEQNVSAKLAEIIQSEIGAESLTLHNLSVLTKEDIANNETYFTLMEQNIETLRKALEKK
ncbi:metal ABC transporter solute-binding protein, Zn/Mn family [Ureibacillus sp. MALMAid1270]|uniref:metal ABC transporter solute-binding protein, Zn/Mn family n=1 Tax=Ureibacillus sp. MALMAid1270 TaxID=3411629 RepID=UPI003BA435A4